MSNSLMRDWLIANAERLGIPKPGARGRFSQPQIDAWNNREGAVKYTPGDIVREREANRQAVTEEAEEFDFQGLIDLTSDGDSVRIVLGEAGFLTNVEITGEAKFVNGSLWIGGHNIAASKSNWIHPKLVEFENLS